MENLETRKLKRDWTGINWIGESSSLTGTDAIAWHQLGKESNQPGQALTPDQKDQLELFYRRLSWLLDNPDDRLQKSSLSLQALREYEEKNPDTSGKYIAPNERLSIPELVKRLVTYDKIADQIGMAKLKQKSSDPEFKEINRNAGYWTGWFMGDGDKVGDKLQLLATKSEDQMKKFTDQMRTWGKDFEAKTDLFSKGKGRVIYAGGDDFLGVLYSEQTAQNQTPDKIKPMEVLNWLLTLPEHWQDLQKDLEKLGFKDDGKDDKRFTFSVGFVWAGHQVPQRDVLQHCREAEKRSKSLGRDRVTIRVVFNSGQFVQWTCPWKDLDILKKYRDRDGKTWEQNPNWTHIYNDWAQLKARHGIRLQETVKNSVKKDIPLALFNLYFDQIGETFNEENRWNEIAGDNTNLAIVNWINDLVQVGWQLCHNSNI
ncbi:Cas10/Cmr2 second palm domain-containing protein [Planktothrix mougeotii]